MDGNTLALALWRAEGPARVLRAAVLVTLGVGLMTAAAKTQVPFWPVPMTLQTLAVFLIGLSYGAQLAGASVGAYLALGILGAPVFAYPGAGPAYVFGPTGGFLLGFLLAAIVLGWLAERGWDRSAWRALPALLAAEVALYVPGVAWLWATVTHDFGATIAAGVTPFLLGDALKILAAAFFLPVAWKLVGKTR